MAYVAFFKVLSLILALFGSTQQDTVYEIQCLQRAAEKSPLGYVIPVIFSSEYAESCC